MKRTSYAITFFLLLLLLVFAFPLCGEGAGFGGVGIDGVPKGDGTIVVRQLVTGGPAHMAGIKAGDVIVQVDGTPTAGNDFKFIVERRLRGRAGTPVLILVRRAGHPKPIAFKMIRRQLTVAGTKKEQKGN